MKPVFIVLSLLTFLNFTFAKSGTADLHISSVVANSTSDSVLVRSKDGGETLNVSTNPLLTIDDLKSAKVLKEGKEARMSVKINESAALKLRSYTANHAGERLAVIVNGELVSAPAIRDTIKNDFVFGPMGLEQAESLAKLINHRK